MDYGHLSMFTLGGYDVTKFAPNSTITWNPLVDSKYWSVRLSSATIGDQAIPISVSKAIIDSGTSYLVIPKQDFQAIVAYFEQSMVCAEDIIHGLYQCICSLNQLQENYPPLNVTLSA